MYHMRMKGDHYQMGVKRGRIFQKSRLSFPLRLDEISFVAWRGLRLPLNEARVWEKCYALMGRPQKAKRIAVSLLARREEK